MCIIHTTKGNEATETPLDILLQKHIEDVRTNPNYALHDATE